MAMLFFAIFTDVVIEFVFRVNGIFEVVETFILFRTAVKHIAAKPCRMGKIRPEAITFRLFETTAAFSAAITANTSVRIERIFRITANG
jgi:hypothetical protein